MQLAIVPKAKFFVRIPSARDELKVIGILIL